MGSSARHNLQLSQLLKILKCRHQIAIVSFEGIARSAELVQIHRGQMLERAQNMQWDRVAELEGRRKELVIRCFQSPTSVQDVPAVAAAIQEILRLNRAISELGRDCRDRLSAEIQTHKVGCAASLAYLNCIR